MVGCGCGCGCGWGSGWSILPVEVHRCNADVLQLEMGGRREGWICGREGEEEEEGEEGGGGELGGG